MYVGLNYINVLSNPLLCLQKTEEQSDNHVKSDGQQGALSKAVTAFLFILILRQVPRQQLRNNTGSNLPNFEQLLISRIIKTSFTKLFTTNILCKQYLQSCFQNQKFFHLSLLTGFDLLSIFNLPCHGQFAEKIIVF